MELTEHTALITGGTAGIGFESARLMAQEGASVIIAGRDRDRGERAATAIGSNARFVHADMAALESLTRTWAAEFGPAGVRVNSVAPGPTRTEGVAAEWGETGEELGRGLPLGRTAYPSEIAEAVLFLSSPRSSFITGSTLHADGGGAAV
jgi:NAD(P)-dependent dehydrogenase (short-subunit alcohol dehydrogenase family)